MGQKSIITWLLVVLSVFCGDESAWAKLVVHSQSAVEIELIGYDGLDQSSIFKGSLAAGSKHELDTPYRGLALLRFPDGQAYPVVIGKEDFNVKITSLDKPPSFSGSPENESFYKALKGGEPVPEKYAFARLMIQAKHLLESSHSIHTLKELTAKKKEFHGFVRKHYDSLKHSDMVMQLIGQYFMMHEYIDYHTEGEPATAIRVHYQKEVVNGVGNWLEILKPYFPEREILNYCVSLYYKRSMVTLASLINENFKDFANCTGDEKETFSFPGDMLITDKNGNKERKLADFKGKKLIAFVSDDCPVSMVETISKVRQLTSQKEALPVIVAPLEKLSRNHLTMGRMISNGNIFFIDDEKWRKDNLAKKIKLPLFLRIGDDSNSGAL